MRRPWQSEEGETEGVFLLDAVIYVDPGRTWPIQPPWRTQGGRYFIYRPPPAAISSADGPGRRSLAGAPPYPSRSARVPLPFLQPELQSHRLCTASARGAHRRRRPAFLQPRLRACEPLTDGDSLALPMGTRGSSAPSISPSSSMIPSSLVAVLELQHRWLIDLGP